MVRRIFTTRNRVSTRNRRNRIFLRRVLSLSNATRLKPTLGRYGRTTCNRFGRRVNYRIGVFKISLRRTSRLRSTRVTRKFDRFRHTIQTNRRDRSIRALTLFQINRHNNSTFTPLLLKITIQIKNTISQSKFSLVRGNKVNRFQRSKRIMVRQVTISSNLTCRVNGNSFTMITINR